MFNHTTDCGETAASCWKTSSSQKENPRAHSVLFLQTVHTPSTFTMFLHHELPTRTWWQKNPIWPVLQTTSKLRFSTTAISISSMLYSHTRWSVYAIMKWSKGWNPWCCLRKAHSTKMGTECCLHNTRTYSHSCMDPKIPSFNYSLTYLLIQSLVYSISHCLCDLGKKTNVILIQLNHYKKKDTHTGAAKTNMAPPGI